MTGGLYLLRLPGDHFYGGRTTDFKRRERDHLRALRRGVHPNPYLQAVYNQHQIVGFERLTAIADEEVQRLAEQTWLDANYGTPGCLNLSLSSEGGMMKGRHHSPEAIAKISAASRGREVFPETRAKLAVSNTGLKRSVETRNRISASLIGDSRNLGKKASEETRQKIAEAQKGNTKNLGKKWTQEARDRRSREWHEKRGLQKPQEMIR